MGMTTCQNLLSAARVMMLLSALQLGIATNALAEEEEGGGGGGGGSGAQAAEILFGMAAMMAAAAPAVSAAIQADADKTIAQTKANAEIQQTKISADTSKYLADQQMAIASAQAQTAQDIAGNAQQQATERLNIQVSQLDKAQAQSVALEAKKLYNQQVRDDQRIQLAEQQVLDTRDLAVAQLRIQEAQAAETIREQTGSSTGAANTFDSGAGLTVRRPTSPSYNVAANAFEASSSVTDTSGLGSSRLNATPLAGANLTATSKAVAASPASATAATRSIASVPGAGERLLASVAPTVSSDTESEKKASELEAKTSKETLLRKAVTTAAARRGVAAGSRFFGTIDQVGLALGQALQSNGNVRGSTAGRKVRYLRGAASSDLSRFTTELTGSR